MKWAPVLVVLGAFGVLLLLTKPSSQSGKAAPASVASAQQAGSQETPKSHGAASKPEASGHGEPAPAAAAPAAAAPAPAHVARPDAGPAVEPVKAPAAAKAAARTPDSIVGQVSDASGEGVPQIVVALLGSDGKEVARKTSDGAGRIVFEGVAPGSYTLATYDPDYLYTARGQTAVTAKKGATTDAALRVERGTSGIRGVVVDGGKKPIADLRVHFTAGGASFSVNSDPKGMFVVNGLVPGTWRVSADGFAGSERSVQLAPDATTDVAFELARPATLEVVLTGSHLHALEIDGSEVALLRVRGDEAAKPLEAKLHVESKESEDRYHAHEVSGVADFGKLAPGDYEIEIVNPAITDLKRMSLLHVGEPWTVSFPVTLREGEAREIVLPSAKAALGRGAEVSTWVIVLMFVVIGGLVFVTPILFPAPLVAKRPPAGAGAAH